MRIYGILLSNRNRSAFLTLFLCLLFISFLLPFFLSVLYFYFIYFVLLTISCTFSDNAEGSIIYFSGLNYVLSIFNGAMNTRQFTMRRQRERERE